MTFSKLLDRRYHGKLDLDADEYLHDIAIAGKRMHNLVQDLLEYSRVNTKGAEFRSWDTMAIVDDALGFPSTKTQENGAIVPFDALP